MTAPQQSALHPAGQDAEVIHQLTWVLSGGAALVFVGVMVLCFMGLRGRREVNIRRWLLGGGVLLPVVVLSALLAFSTWRSAQLSVVSSQHAVKIAVVAHLWWWEVRYADPAGGPDIVLANEIRLPVGQTVYLGLSSADVIHSFWVPALAGKVDMVPGRLHGMTVRVDQPGVYRGQCAEYCGEQHARMALHVVAQSEQEFNAWLAAQAKPAAGATSAQPADIADSAPDAANAANAANEVALGGGKAVAVSDVAEAAVGAGQANVIAAGRKAFAAQRCAACHVVRESGRVAGAGAGAGSGGVAGDQAALGPDLTHVGSRLYIGAGTLPNSRVALAAWVANPHSIKPGVRMPAGADMDAATLSALAAYLEQLK
jgi:cytochrome c oxidase subunit 2